MKFTKESSLSGNTDENEIVEAENELESICDSDKDSSSVNATPGDDSNQLTHVNEFNISENSAIEKSDSDTNGVINEGFEGVHKNLGEDSHNGGPEGDAISGNRPSAGEHPNIEIHPGHVNHILDIEEKDNNHQREVKRTSGEDGGESKEKGSTSYAPVGDKGHGRESSWLSWLRKELRWNKKLIPIKIIQFLYSGGTNSILPYLTLQMQELGLSMRQIGWIYAFLPITTILGPPISGMVADRTGNYKAVVLVNMLLTTFLHLVLLYLPGEGVNRLVFTCGESLDFTSMVWDKCRGCHDRYDGANFTVALKNCKYLCDNPPATTFDLCFDGEEDTTEFCLQHSLKEEVTINGTVTATYTEGGHCGHSWYDLRVGNQTYSGVSCPSEPCSVECEVGGAPSCLLEDEGSPSSVFWTYFFVRITANFFLSSLFTMMDAMTIAIVKDLGGDYGKQRLLFIIGMATVPLAAGFLNDWDAGSNGTSFYLPALYLGAVLCLASAVLIARLNFKVDVAENNMFHDLRQLVTRPEINLYFLVILVLGSNWGFIESYLFLYMGKLGSPNYVMGLTMTVGSIIGMPTMLVADAVIKIIGRHNIFIISFFAYALRHFGYSFISSPWMVFPFELLEVFTYQLMWVAAITYCPILAPPGLLATMTGVAGAIHFSIGRGVGSFIGGQLITQMDIPGAFRCFGVIAIVSGVLYILLHVFYFKKKIAGREMELKRSEGANSGMEMMENN
ncbi:major facilitator superfamily domain-containing protein 6-like isoform X2 [Macrobrachium nipponense]|uniref:major facilitator superfamily domain-containing protein 6-like isoform X2 n=1 Tax=Macrobrachium nipponense TaxID=159736 RepID=UPI0030C88758